mmetsp:Transcript_10764/g.25714  ORF Transcript_10764/g.25714 Transcript_10764/m.25714 type:complete len:213 (+) Transcript_10764:284-922(+)
MGGVLPCLDFRAIVDRVGHGLLRINLATEMNHRVPIVARIQVLDDLGGDGHGDGPIGLNFSHHVLLGGTQREATNVAVVLGVVQFLLLLEAAPVALHLVAQLILIARSTHGGNSLLVGKLEHGVRVATIAPFGPGRTAGSSLVRQINRVENPVFLVDRDAIPHGQHIDSGEGVAAPTSTLVELIRQRVLPLWSYLCHLIVPIEILGRRSMQK